MPVAEKDWPLYVPSLTLAERKSYESVAMRCSRGVRGCTPDSLYNELIDRIVEALAFATGKIDLKKDRPVTDSF